MNFIIRKPKFMRDEAAMEHFIKMAEVYSKKYFEVKDLKLKKYHLSRINEYFDKASKAAGFFRTKDFFKWFNS